MPIPFRQHMDVLSKSPAPAHGLAGQDARQAPSGVAFLFGYLSLWPRKEKVTRLPEADESFCSASRNIRPSKSIARERAPTRQSSSCATGEVRFLPSQE
jgi:hypothetical protein